MITYSEAKVKLEFRLNKSGTEDYMNIDHDIATEAIKKAMNDWVRRQYHGSNQYREGAEESRMRVDDLQVLLRRRNISLKTGPIFSESNTTLPKEYRYYNNLYFNYNKEGCAKTFVIPSYLQEEANVSVLLSEDGTKPSFDYEQYFHTLAGNKIQFYHNGEFQPREVVLVYYKEPKEYNSRKEFELFEFKDDIVELIIDEAAKIISGDTDNYSQNSRNTQSVENNN